MSRYPLLGTLALALTAALADGAAAQQQTSNVYRDGDCLYQVTTNSVMPQGQPGAQQRVLLGCYLVIGGRVWYGDVAREALRDERTGIWFRTDASGTVNLWTDRGWQAAASHPAGAQLLAEMAAANGVATPQQPVSVTVGPMRTTPLEEAIRRGDTAAVRILREIQDRNDYIVGQLIRR